MAQGSTRTRRPMGRRTPALLVCAIWLSVICWALPRLGPVERVGLGMISTASALATMLILNRTDRARWVVPSREMAERIRGLAHQRPSAVLEPTIPEFEAVARAVEELRTYFRDKMKLRKLMAAPGRGTQATGFPEFENAYSPESGEFNLAQSANFSTAEMVNRLDPRSFAWIESSVAEQGFLGWTLPELRRRSFLEIVTEDDRKAASEALRQALERGESLGQVVRVVTAAGEAKDVELNVGTRYGTDKTISHLRCHLTDVTEKVRAERELRSRTLELTRANEQLLRINHELEELKDRYTDLYQNAPAMYFSLNRAGEMVECNLTLLSTLDRTRSELIGRPYELLLAEGHREEFRVRFQALLGEEAIEMQSPWRKSNGEVIEVWINASLVRGPGDKMDHARCVARDVTARRRLEAELERKNESLGRANAELSLKNRELDDFVYVVSHDLQEPLRTLVAFSDFLLKDYGDRLDEEGREYVHYLIDASRRMRAMILAMLNLSRAGRVIGDFAPVDVSELLSVVRADLAELVRGRKAEIRIAGPLPMVWGDWNRLSQLFANLVANGLKFNRDPSPLVEVGSVEEADASPPGRNPGAFSETTDDSVTLYIKDNGIGIDPEFHRTIFQLFRRLHTQEEFEGTGAGLAICSKIVHAHGGRIWIESTPDAGSTFYVRLRRCPSRPPGEDQVVVPSSLTVAPQDRADESHTV